MMSVLLLFLKLAWFCFRVLFSISAFGAAVMFVAFAISEIKEYKNKRYSRKNRDFLLLIVIAIIFLCLCGIGIWLI